MYITETERTIHNQYINVEAKKAKAKAMIIANNAYGCQAVHPSITCKYARPKVIVHDMDKENSKYHGLRFVIGMIPSV